MVQAASRRREDAHAPGDEAVANTRGRQPAIDADADRAGGPSRQAHAYGHGVRALRVQVAADRATRVADADDASVPGEVAERLVRGSPHRGRRRRRASGLCVGGTLTDVIVDDASVPDTT